MAFGGSILVLAYDQVENRPKWRGRGTFQLGLHTGFQQGRSDGHSKTLTSFKIRVNSTDTSGVFRPWKRAGVAKNSGQETGWPA